ncbi:PITH domain-containing protein GA19395 [Cylas formicarius]|uniref:PITH domain-containing protein GA19395 n=1 Tax=Cylas formicarius TaxID=197179 RepID=UPI002958B844|nr:PITH domain-containing protein GA19395 [Cylas formicarius]
MAALGHCGEDCAHKHEDPEKGVLYSLYTKIIIDNLECLNESVEGAGKTVFKPWIERLDTERFVESDVDEELLFNIPFSGHIKLKGIIVIGDDSESHPSKMRLFKNRDALTFDDVAIEADQEFDLQKDIHGNVEYFTKIAKFQNVHHLGIHFPSNFGDEKTRIYYIGLKGEFAVAPKQEVVICNYELRPNISDHKNPLSDDNNHPLM